MKLTMREMVLACAATAIVLGGLTLTVGRARIGAWHKRTQTRTSLEQQVKMQDRLVRQRGKYEAELEEARATLPRHAAAKDVTTELLRWLDQTARQNGLMLSRRDPEAEKSGGFLYEMTINCTWEGSLEALTRFLYTLQTQGAHLDARQLTVNPAPNDPDRLRGTVSVIFAYSRQPAEPGEGGAAETAGKD